MIYLIYALVVWNAISFLLFGIDKYSAIKNRRRISEKTLILTSFLFGSVGSLLGMITFRHKIRHIKFILLIPISVVINIIIIGGYYFATR